MRKVLHRLLIVLCLLWHPASAQKKFSTHQNEIALINDIIDCNRSVEGYSIAIEKKIFVGKRLIIADLPIKITASPNDLDESGVDIKLYKRISNRNKLRWNKLLCSNLVISSKKLEKLFQHGKDSYSLLEKKYGDHIFWEFSAPLFDKSFNHAIVEIAYHCGGLCGYGGTFLYAKTNNKWVYVKTIGYPWRS